MGLLDTIENSFGRQEEETFKAHSLPAPVRDRVAAEEAAQVKGFDEIAGLDPLVRQKLYDWRYELRNAGSEKVPQQFRTILLSGTQGVGKTMLADALIKEAGESAEKFNPDQLIKEKGWDPQNPPSALYDAILARSVELSREDNNRNQWSSRKRNRTLVVFMDEMERFFPKRTKDGNNTSAAIVRLNDLAEKNNIWIIGTTNHPELMSAAVFSRFEEVPIDKPDISQLIDLFAYYIALTDFEARKQKRDLFDDALIEKIHDYRDTAIDYEEYMSDHPTSEPETDSTMEKKVKQYVDKAKILAKALGPAIKDANGLTQRDIALVIKGLAKKKMVELARKEDRDEMGMRTGEIRKITLDDIQQELLFRKLRNDEYEEKVRENTNSTRRAA